MKRKINYPQTCKSLQPTDVYIQLRNNLDKNIAAKKKEKAVRIIYIFRGRLASLPPSLFSNFPSPHFLPWVSYVNSSPFLFLSFPSASRCLYSLLLFSILLFIILISVVLLLTFFPSVGTSTLSAPTGHPSPPGGVSMRVHYLGIHACMHAWPLFMTYYCHS